MRIDNTAIALRRREPWEAIDLGFAMLREWWRPAYTAWAVTFVPVAAALTAVFRDDPWIAALLLWWLKPVFDRVVLHVLSRAVFGEDVAVAHLARDWREFLAPALVAGQLWARVDLARAFDLPVWQLERVTGFAAGRRRKALQRKARYHAVWLTAMCAIFEGVVLLGLVLSADVATPVKATTGWMFENLFSPGSDGPGWGVGLTLAYALAITVIEPFYVAGGFSLYLNRRTLLEGWDIELALRDRAERAAARKALAAAVLAALLIRAAAPLPAVAADTDAARSAREEIAEVLKGPEFPHLRETTAWRVRWPAWEWPEWLKFSPGARMPRIAWSLGEPVQSLVKIAMWLAVAVAASWLLYRLVRLLPPHVEPAGPPPVLFGLEIAPEALPPDIAAKAAQLVAERRTREALSLLYRGALSALVHAKGVELRPGDTERDCLRRAQTALPREASAYFDELVAAWVAAAYAGRLPADERAHGLVAAWTVHFAPAVG